MFLHTPHRLGGLHHIHGICIPKQRLFRNIFGYRCTPPTLDRVMVVTSYDVDMVSIPRLCLGGWRCMCTLTCICIKLLCTWYVFVVHVCKDTCFGGYYTYTYTPHTCTPMHTNAHHTQTHQYTHHTHTQIAIALVGKHLLLKLLINTPPGLSTLCTSLNTWVGDDDDVVYMMMTLCT